MDSIVLEVFQMYILEVWFAAPQVWAHRFETEMLPYTAREFGIYLAMFLPVFFIQLLLLRKCRRKWLRALPLELAVIALVTAEVLWAALSGWDKLLGHVLAFAGLYWLLGAALGALVWWLAKRKKRHHTAI